MRGGRRLLVLAWVGAAACRPAPYSGPVTGKVLLRYHPPAGARYPYAFSQLSTTQEPNSPAAAMGTSRLELAMWFTQAVGLAAGGAVPLTAVIDSARVVPPIPGGDPAQLAGARVTMVVDDHMRVVRADPASPLSREASMTAEQMMASLRTMTFPFADGAVGTGDSWSTKIQVPYTDFAGGTSVFATTRLTVKTLEVVRGDTIVGLAIQAQLPEKPIPVVIFGQRSTITLSGTINGTQRFSLTRGAILATDYAGTIRSTMKGGMFGRNEMRLDLMQQASLTLQSGETGGGR